MSIFKKNTFPNFIWNEKMNEFLKDDNITDDIQPCIFTGDNTGMLSVLECDPKLVNLIIKIIRLKANIENLRSF